MNWIDTVINNKRTIKYFVNEEQEERIRKVTYTTLNLLTVDEMNKLREWCKVSSKFFEVTDVIINQFANALNKLGLDFKSVEAEEEIIFELISQIISDVSITEFSVGNKITIAENTKINSLKGLCRLEINVIKSDIVLCTKSFQK